MAEWLECYSSVTCSNLPMVDLSRKCFVDDISNLGRRFTPPAPLKRACKLYHGFTFVGKKIGRRNCLECTKSQVIVTETLSVLALFKLLIMLIHALTPRN